MHVYWTELSVDGKTGNDARDYVNTQLGVPVGGDGKVKPATLTVESKEVSSELVVPMLRELAKKKGFTWNIVFKEDRQIQKRQDETVVRLDRKLQREALNTLKKKPLYVIVGCGAAAVVNHTTLRQTKWGEARAGKHEIVHVGFEDPWGHYNKHEMGQFPQLLGLPGYEGRPELTKENVKAPHWSTEFGGCTAREMERLKKQIKRTTSELEVIRACVLAIQVRGIDLHDSAVGSIVKEGIPREKIQQMLEVKHPDTEPRYRLLLSNAKRDLSWLYADMIDICSGAGKPRTVDETMVSTEVYESVRTRLWEPVESWDDEKKQRRILSGTEALYAKTDWTVGKRYCVMGGGGVGVNMVERARDTDKWLDWLAPRTLHPSFPIGRNDILLRGPHEKTGSAITKEGKPFAMDDFAAGRESYLEIINPRAPKWRFGQGADLQTVGLASDVVTIHFKEAKLTWIKDDIVPDGNRKDVIPAVMRDYYQEQTAWAGGVFPYSTELAKNDTALASKPPGAFDRLIRCSGQDIRDVGQAEKIAVHLFLDPILAPSDGRMLGLTSEDGTVRVLGAAGTGNAVMVAAREAQTPYGRMDAYHKTLPAQGRILLVGFVFSALNIATANHYFDEKEGMKPNTNVNTMSEAELTTALGDAVMAAKVIAARQETQDGFLSIDALIMQFARLDNMDALIAHLKAEVLKRHEIVRVSDTWEQEVRSAGLEALDEWSLTHMQTKIAYPFPGMIVDYRDERRKPYAKLRSLTTQYRAPDAFVF